MQPPAPANLIGLHHVRLCVGAVGQPDASSLEQDGDLPDDVDLDEGPLIDEIELARDARRTSDDQSSPRTEVHQLKGGLRGASAESHSPFDE
jgi:hypothetical protein